MKTGSSRSGSGLAALAGIACVACCALPVLVSGVLSGAGAVFLADEMPVIAIALAIMAAVAFGMAARRKVIGDKGGCGGSCKHAPRADGACGCAGTSE